MGQLLRVSSHRFESGALSRSSDVSIFAPDSISAHYPNAHDPSSNSAHTGPHRDSSQQQTLSFSPASSASDHSLEPMTTASSISPFKDAASSVSTHPFASAC